MVCLFSDIGYTDTAYCMIRIQWHRRELMAFSDASKFKIVSL